MKKNIKWILLILALAVLTSLIAYKVIFIRFYRLDKILNNEIFETFEKGMNNAKNITIKHLSTTDNNVSLNLDGLTMRNDFTSYEKREEIDPLGTGLKFQKYDESGKITEGIWIYSGKNMVSLMKEDYEVYGDKAIIGTKEDREEFLNEKNITTDLDLYKFILENKDYRANLFTSNKEIKYMHEIYQTFQILVSFSEDITFINGDIEGILITRNNNLTICSLYKDDKLYQITFIGEKFTDSYIEELLSTIIISY